MQRVLCWCNRQTKSHIAIHDIGWDNIVQFTRGCAFFAREQASTAAKTKYNVEDKIYIALPAA